MSLDIVPYDILLNIKEYIVYDDKYYGVYHLKEKIKDSITFYLTTKVPYDIEKIKLQIRLLNKYNKYNLDYEWYYMNFHVKNKIKEILPHPILFDILFSGCYLPGAKYSHTVFNEYTFEDLKQCIQLFPNSIHSDFGHLRCMFNLTPLYAACVNSLIPLYVIQYLIECGSDYSKTIFVNGQEYNLSQTIEYCTYYRDSRIIRIQDLMNV